MSKKTLTEKFLIIFDGLVQETGALLYPYKGLNRLFKKYKGNLSKAIYSLKQRGYLEEVEVNNVKALRFTAKGKLKIISFSGNKKWDGLWRLVAFDIEERRRKTRNLFRTKLRELGCKPIQKSLWLSPYNISESLEGLIDLLNLKNNVEYFVTKIMSDNEKYLEMFKLKNINKA